jgi:hypothetical protein
MKKKNIIYKPTRPTFQEEDPDEQPYHVPRLPHYPEVEPNKIPEEDPYELPPIEIPIGKG